MDEQTLLDAIRGVVREEVRAETEPLKADIAEMKQDVQRLNRTTSKIELDHGRKLDGLYESVVGTGEKFASLDELRAKVEEQGHKIWALEQQLKAQ